MPAVPLAPSCDNQIFLQTLSMLLGMGTGMALSWRSVVQFSDVLESPREPVKLSFLFMGSEVGQENLHF